MKFIAIIVGGIGPDVWDRDVEIDAVDFADAAQQAQGKAEEMGGRVLTMEESYTAEEVCRQRVAAELDVRELRDVKEYLWPNQTGLPNEHRSALIAIQAREKLLHKRITLLEEERDRYKPLVENLSRSLTCHCFTNGPEADAGIHKASCRIGEARAALGLKPNQKERC